MRTLLCTSWQCSTCEHDGGFPPSFFFGGGGTVFEDDFQSIRSKSQSQMGDSCRGRMNRAGEGSDFEKLSAKAGQANLLKCLYYCWISFANA